MCSLQLKQCHAWQSNGLSFLLVVLTLAMLLVPAGWPQQLAAAALLAVVVYQGLANHRRTDELIYGAHRLMDLTQELRGKQLLIEQQNQTLAAEVHARTAELREANMRLAAANLELLELDKLRSAVLSNVSHELRTPLTGILGSAQNLRDGLAGGLTTQQQDYVRMIEADSGRLIRVVNELLEWSRSQAGCQTLQREPVAVQALVDEVFMLLGPVAQQKSVRLEQEGETTARVQADRDKLKQVLINLVGNAIKFTGAGTRVRVQVRAGAALEVTVDDEGPGVAPEDLPHLFERFFRGRGSEAASGSGLGLAIARNLARLHGGDIQVRPAVPHGSAFTLTMPAMGAAA